MIHGLPGMGADRRMFPSPWDTLPNFRAHDWPPYAGETTLSDMAQRMVQELTIRDGDCVVGASLGGMIACELAKIRKLHWLCLVGSATTKSEVSGLLALLSPLARFVPLNLLRQSAGSIPSEMAQMFASVDPAFVRAMCAAVFQWDGFADPRTRCIRIHGASDRIIPPPTHSDLLVDGGHLIAITHAKECVEFLMANHCVERTGGSLHARFNS